LGKFFRQRLLTLDNDAIVKLIKDYEKEVRAMKDDALRMSWYMRGGVSYEDIIMFSQVERELVSKIIKDNLDTTEKSKLPFF
jgi:hypothetical protein